MLGCAVNDMVAIGVWCGAGFEFEFEESGEMGLSWNYEWNWILGTHQSSSLKELLASGLRHGSPTHDEENLPV